jgi:hypothetical protein
MRSHHTAAALSAGNIGIVDTLGGLQHDATIADRGFTRDRGAAPTPSSIEYVALLSLRDILLSAASIFREVSSFCDAKGYPLRRE